ncbi:MAG: hypothetical protein ACPG8R_08200 [Flavobacteriales bacterium]
MTSQPRWFTLLATTLLSWSALLPNEAAAQTQLYELQGFRELALTHTTIAILPFKGAAFVSPLQSMMQDDADIRRESDLRGLEMQATLESWFLKRSERGKFIVQVQPTTETNAILNDNDVTLDNLTERTPQEVAKLLGVDAIVTGTVQARQPSMLMAAAVSWMTQGGSNVNSYAMLDLEVYDTEYGELQCNYRKRILRSQLVGESRLLHILARKTSRRIAYKGKL